MFVIQTSCQSANGKHGQKHTNNFIVVQRKIHETTQIAKQKSAISIRGLQGLATLSRITHIYPTYDEIRMDFFNQASFLAKRWCSQFGLPLTFRRFTACQRSLGGTLDIQGSIVTSLKPQLATDPLRVTSPMHGCQCRNRLISARVEMENSTSNSSMCGFCTSLQIEHAAGAAANASNFHSCILAKSLGNNMKQLKPVGGS